MRRASSGHDRDDLPGRDKTPWLSAGALLSQSAILPGILLLAVQADPQGLHAADRQPGILRPQHGADGVLVEVDLFGQLRVLDHHQAGDGVVVPGQVLGGAVDGDIGTQVQRAQQVGGQEGVVGDQQQIVFAADSGERPQIGEFEERIGEGLDEQRPGGGCDGRLHGSGVAGVHIGEGQAVLAEDLVEQPTGAAVEVFGDDQVVAAILNSSSRLAMAAMPEE